MKLNKILSAGFAFGLIVSVGAGVSAYQVNGDKITVESGDTLYTIATDHNLTVDELKTINGLDSDLIFPDQELSIASDSVHVVVSGDTLYSLAQDNGVTVDAIKTENNLESDLIVVGDTLVIPEPVQEPVEEPAANTHTVVSGDTLYSLAQTHNTTVDELKTLNNLDSDLIIVGDVLTLPAQ